MNRKALLISSPGDPKDKNYAPFVKDTIKRYKEFLKKPVGGGWHEDKEISEIVEFGEDNPLTEDQLDNLLSELDELDYSFVFFCGHGGMENGKSKILLPNIDNTLYPVDKLASASLPKYDSIKRLVVVDACRSPIQTLITESKGFGEDFDVPYGSECVELYNSIIEKANPHVELYQSTGPLEYANANKLFGPYYSEIILQLIKELFKSYH